MFSNFFFGSDKIILSCLCHIRRRVELENEEGFFRIFYCSAIHLKKKYQFVIYFKLNTKLPHFRKKLH